MALKISEVGLSLIKQFEGCRLSSYKCPAGVWTIGYGHTSGVTQGQTITEEDAAAYLREDVNKFENAVNAYDNIYHFTQNQFDALVSFAFNCGTGNLKNLTNNGKRSISQISAKLPLYNKAGGVVLAGLTHRRLTEKSLFDSVTENNTLSYYPKYTGESEKVDEVLSDIGAIADYDNTQEKPYLKRLPIAAAQNIKKYTGTAAQNNKIIALAKSGKLRRL